MWPGGQSASRLPNRPLQSTGTSAKRRFSWPHEPYAAATAERATSESWVVGPEFRGRFGDPQEGMGEAAHGLSPGLPAKQVTPLATKSLPFSSRINSSAIPEVLSKGWSSNSGRMKWAGLPSAFPPLLGMKGEGQAESTRSFSEVLNVRKLLVDLFGSANNCRRPGHRRLVSNAGGYIATAVRP